MTREASPPCQSDLACFRNDGHTGNHAYPSRHPLRQPVTGHLPAVCCRDHAVRACGHSLSAIEDLMTDIEQQAATIATLRAALDGLAKAAALPRNCGGGVTLKGEWIAVPKADFDALRAALAAAKEATDAG
jgi:hypothetical protein